MEVIKKCFALVLVCIFAISGCYNRTYIKESIPTTNKKVAALNTFDRKIHFKYSYYPETGRIEVLDSSLKTWKKNEVIKIYEENLDRFISKEKGKESDSDYYLIDFISLTNGFPSYSYDKRYIFKNVYGVGCLTCLSIYHEDKYQDIHGAIRDVFAIFLTVGIPLPGIMFSAISGEGVNNFERRFSKSSFSAMADYFKSSLSYEIVYLASKSINQHRQQKKSKEFSSFEKQFLYGIPKVLKFYGNATKGAFKTVKIYSDHKITPKFLEEKKQFLAGTEQAYKQVEKATKNVDDFFEQNIQIFENASKKKGISRQEKKKFEEVSACFMGAQLNENFFFSAALEILKKNKEKVGNLTKYSDKNYSTLVGARKQNGDIAKQAIQQQIKILSKESGFVEDVFATCESIKSR